ncbi:MAG: efflux RND transporter periplasmic adaptor subunit [Pirellulaceae bacterium]
MRPSWLRRGLWLLLIAGVLAGGGWGVRQWKLAGSETDNVLTGVALRGDLVLSVTDRGELESAQSVQVVCEIEGGGKLVTIVPEGTRVKKGAEVARFDTDAHLRAISEQEVKWQTAVGRVKTAESDLEVQKNKAESEVAKAELALTLAKIDFESYEEGEYQVELDKRKGTLELGKKELKEAEDNLEFTRGLVKKGFAQLEQIRVMELNALSKRYTVSQQDADLRVLQKFTRLRKVTELEAKAKEAKSELERTGKSQAAATDKTQNDLTNAQKTTELEKKELERLQAQLEKCIVKAPQDGIVIYFSRPWDQESQIRAGAQLYSQQLIFTLPDLDNMQVKMKVHESVVKKVRQKQSATMQIDALPNQTLHGQVKTIASVAQNDGWRGGGVKEYQTEVSIDDLPTDAGLRPGMTAEVTIHLRTIENALTVPVQAVTELDGEYVAYVVGPAGIERRTLKVGDSNEQLIEVLAGLAENDRVALDARSRASLDLKRSNESQSPDKKEPDKNEPPKADEGAEPAAVVAQK